MVDDPFSIRASKGIHAVPPVETRGESSKRSTGPNPCVETHAGPIDDIAEPDLHLETIDQASAQLILQLQREDFQHLEERNKGKEREGVITDSAQAQKFYKYELDAVQQIMSDRRMAESIAAAVQHDGRATTLHHEQETRVTVDHQAASSLGGARVPTTSTAPPASEEYYDAFVSRLSAGDASNDMEEREISVPRIECEICRDSVPQNVVANLPCGHPYCTDCLQSLFRAALHDETLFPPKCCQKQIAVDIAQPFLESGLIQAFEKKKVEFDTLDKTYCCLPTCSRFIPPTEINDDRAVCGNCGTTTCSICKATSHEDSCPQDNAMNELILVSRDNGWQKCVSCKRMIELVAGCYHMTCPCGFQFCYRCGEKWKACDCPRWEEAQLVDGDNQIADREPNPQLQRARRVERAIRNLRQGCAHESWASVSGRHACDECLDSLPSFILRCRECRLQACVRCRRNRL